LSCSANLESAYTKLYALAFPPKSFPSITFPPNIYSISNCAFATGEKSETAFLYCIPSIPASSNIFLILESDGGLRFSDLRRFGAGYN